MCVCMCVFVCEVTVLYSKQHCVDVSQDIEASLVCSSAASCYRNTVYPALLSAGSSFTSQLGLLKL